MAKCNTKMRKPRRKHSKEPQAILLLPQPARVMSLEMQEALRAGIIDSYQMGDIKERTVIDNQKNTLLYLKWCNGNGFQAVPCSDEQAEAFVIYAANKTESRETLLKWMQSIRWLHKMVGIDDWYMPTRCKRRLTAATNTGMVKQPKQSNPITGEMLDALAMKVNVASRAEMLPMMILMIQHSMGARVDEVRLLERRHCRPHEDGTADVMVARSKMDQGGVGMWKLLNRTAYAYWLRFQKLHPVQSEYLISRENGEPYAAGTVKVVVQNFLRKHGVDASSHGARIGFVQDSVSVGIDPLMVVKYVGWKGPAQYLNYTRNVSVQNVGRQIAEAFGR